MRSIMANKLNTQEFRPAMGTFAGLFPVRGFNDAINADNLHILALAWTEYNTGINRRSRC